MGEGWPDTAPTPDERYRSVVMTCGGLRDGVPPPRSCRPAAPSGFLVGKPTIEINMASVMLVRPATCNRAHCFMLLVGKGDSDALGSLAGFRSGPSTLPLACQGSGLARREGCRLLRTL